MGPLTETLEKFDEDNHISSDRGSHAPKSADKDLQKIIKQLTSSQAFKVIPGRNHKSFRNFRTNMIRSLKKEDVKEWIFDHYYPIQVDSKHVA